MDHRFQPPDLQNNRVYRVKTKKICKSSPGKVSRMALPKDDLKAHSLLSINASCSLLPVDLTSEMKFDLKKDIENHARCSTKDYLPK